MLANSIGIRFHSLKDATHQSMPNILLYIKKLIVSSESESEIAFVEKDCEPTILKFGRTFDFLPDDDYIEILFIDSKTKSKSVSKRYADLFFARVELVQLFNECKHGDIRQDLYYTRKLEGNYILKYSLVSINESMPDERHLKRKTPKYHLINDHLMENKQFNEPVFCVMCDKFIWGAFHQGYQCKQCLLVTDRFCRHSISFKCLRGPSSATGVLSQNNQSEESRPHQFKKVKAAFMRILTSNDRNYCRHCGSQVLINALVCGKCDFVIHESCKYSVPAMCRIAYTNSMDHPLLLQNRSPCQGARMRRSSSLNSASSHSIPRTPILDQRSLPLPKFSDFKCIGRLGAGHYGKVYAVQHIPSEEYFAIKVVDGSIKEARQHFNVEKSVLYHYHDNNPYIVKIYCTFHHANNLFLVMTIVDGDPLNCKMKKNPMNENEIRFYLAEIISVLEHLHKRYIIYRDLKLDHVMINSEGHIRLVDFGLARVLKPPNDRCYTICGTDGYIAPEIQRLEENKNEDGYSFAVDYWALGIIFMQMLCNDEFNFSFKLFSENNRQLPDHISLEARSCLQGLLETDPSRRLGSPNSPHGPIREHAFFQVPRKLDWLSVDEGIIKPISTNNDGLISQDSMKDTLLPNICMERGFHVIDEWTAYGKAACSAENESQYFEFDFINESTWKQIIN